MIEMRTSSRQGITVRRDSQTKPPGSSITAASSANQDPALDKSTPYQNSSFTLNWSVRGSLSWLLTVPKAAEVGVVLGLANCT